ncbi:MAG: ATP-binding cassette domain-containing protein [Planctomycetota bacterium]
MTAAAAGVAFRARGARVELGGQGVLDGLDLELRPGERVAVLGPSGAGKTTLLRLLGAAIDPTAGRLEIDGRSPRDGNPEVRRRIRAELGFVHQDHALIPQVRVATNVIAGALGRRSRWSALRSLVRPTSDDLERAHQILDSLGVGELLFRRSDRLSGGEAQRVAIARALFQEPRALLADEPVASVDPARAQDLLERVIDLARERDATLVASLHDLELARRLFPRILGLRAGRLVFDRRREELDPRELDDLFRFEESPQSG